MDKKKLWLQIANYHFDHLAPPGLWTLISAKIEGKNPYTRAFADKLTRKFLWPTEFSMEAIWEYKKFVYLGVISDFSVTPSKVIDQVWHEHLLFTTGYRKFCEEIIQYDFVHNPELVPLDSQIESFKAQYDATIKLYKTEFGSYPPVDFWDDTKFSAKGAPPKKKPKEKTNDGVLVNSYDGNDSLIGMYGSSNDSFFDFGGGESGGGGAGGGWDDGSADVSDSGGDGGSDGGSDGGGSSCSSSCGGGCGGGD